MRRVGQAIRGADRARRASARRLPDAVPLRPSETAARIAREQIVAIHHASAQRIMRGDHTDERAAILLLLVAGIQMMRQMIGLRALADADRDILVDLLAPLFATLLND